MLNCFKKLVKEKTTPSKDMCLDHDRYDLRFASLNVIKDFMKNMLKRKNDF